MRLLFEECVLDVDQHELTRAGRVVPLSPKAFCLLEVLVERRPGVVAKTELRRRVWPDGVAGGTTLARLVNEVRSAIGDQARSERLIRTVPRVGYAFAGTAVEEPGLPRAPASACALQWGTRQVPLSAGENVIGRAADAMISVASRRVSRRHARILVADGRATLEDLGSRNGTYLGERSIAAPTELKHGDLIRIGPIRLLFRVANAEETTQADLRP